LHRIDLPGLDASNLLGYMAALGAMRVLTFADPGVEVKLNWTEEPGWWMPQIHHADIQDDEQLIARLTRALQADLAWEIGNDLTITREAFAAAADESAKAAFHSAPHAMACAFFAAFGSDGCGSAAKEELIADTEFRTMSGAGHQHFLGFMRDLHAMTTIEHLRTALFQTWEYQDEKPSMRWDPNDHRPHALRADNPATDPIRTARGANRLAAESLPLFPTMPSLGRLRTTGFDSKARLTYPVWTGPLDCASTASVLALAELQAEKPDRRLLRGRGIEQAFRSQRFTDGKYRNFSPSRELL
jgi:hypothetical protein